MPPEAARALFGDRLAIAEQYAAWLCGAGVERGLIGPREAPRIWERHLVNCALLAAEIPPAARVVDIGSGAGLPGIPVLLARPDLAMTLCEPLLRRAQFLTEVRDALHLPLVVVRARAEELPAAAFDVVLARAVAPLERLVPMARPLLAPGGLLLALKGRSAQDEMDAVTGAVTTSGGVLDLVTSSAAGESAAIVRIRWPQPATQQATRRRSR